MKWPRYLAAIAFAAIAGLLIWRIAEFNPWSAPAGGTETIGATGAAGAYGATKGNP